MRNYNLAELYPNSRLLSSSQLLDYMRDPAQFYQRWIAGFPMKQSPALVFGIGFSELYADRDFDYRTYMLEGKVPKRLVDRAGEVIRYFPKPHLPEHELRCEHLGWTFRVTLDDFYPESGLIVENKTSSLVWTQETCDTHSQLDLQEWAYWKLNGKPCKKHRVNWVDTTIHAKQPVKSFETIRTIAQLQVFEGYVNTALDNLEKGNFSEKLF